MHCKNLLQSNKGQIGNFKSHSSSTNVWYKNNSIFSKYRWVRHKNWFKN